MFRAKTDRKLKEMEREEPEKRKDPPIRKRSRMYSQIEFKNIEEYTKVINIGEHISCKIRLQETIYPDTRKRDVNVDIRKFLNGKYPFKYGKQGLSIPKDKWLTFMQQAIDFTADVFGKEVFYSDEPEPQTLPTELEPIQEEKQREISPDELLRISIARKPVSELNWGELSKMGKKKN